MEASEANHGVDEGRAGPFGRPQALVIEDEPEQRTVLARILKMLGFEVTEAPDGQVALEQLVERRSSFDVIILDIMLPFVDGVEVARRALAVDPELRFIACSAVLQGENEEVLRRLGVRGFLPKPYSIEELVATIRRVSSRAPR
jgi:DNA-binding response OmpR family regulator